MSLQLTFPFGEKKSVKNLVFSILINEYPLKLIELTNYIKKRYGKSVTFQAVRKATMQLVEDKVLIRNEKEFRINTEWVREAKQVIDSLHHQMHVERQKPKLESIGKEVSVFSFTTPNEMMKFWQDIVDDWYEHFREGDLKLNCWKGEHIWEGILHLDREEKVMDQLKKKGIESYAVCTGSNPLDRSAIRFYRKLGLKTVGIPSHSWFDKSHYIGTYGETIIQAKYPDKFLNELDLFFKNNTNLEELDLNELAKIANVKDDVKLTVIKNRSMAEHINQSIIKEVEENI